MIPSKQLSGSRYHIVNFCLDITHFDSALFNSTENRQTRSLLYLYYILYIIYRIIDIKKHGTYYMSIRFLPAVSFVKLNGTSTALLLMNEKMSISKESKSKLISFKDHILVFPKRIAGI